METVARFESDERAADGVSAAASKTEANITPEPRGRNGAYAREVSQAGFSRNRERI